MKAADLNLLMHFDALMTSNSVSQAGELLGISQPAMSSALSRLRYLFGDPLLQRQGNRWIPTARALELHRSFQPMLQTWRRSTSRDVTFDPATSQRVFNVCASDYLQLAVFPRVLPAVQAHGPGIGLRCLPPKLSGALEMLAENYVELYIGHYPDPPDNLRARFLFEEACTCVVRKDHPALEGAWNLDTYLRYDHINVSGYANYFNVQVDAALRSQGVQRNVAVLLSSYMATSFVVAQTDMIATLPVSVASQLQGVAGIELLPAPLPLPPLSVSLYWHERYQSDDAHAWLRQRMGQAFDDSAWSTRSP